MYLEIIEYFSLCFSILYWSSLGRFDNKPRIERMNMTNMNLLEPDTVIGTSDTVRCPAAIAIDEKRQYRYLKRNSLLV